MEKITVLVTGSKGYIGQHLCKMLSEYSNIEVYTIDIINDSELYYICADIRYNTLPKIKFDTVIHLAALVKVGESVNNPIEYYNTNINGTQRLLEELYYDNFIFASTGAAENPTSPYALSKRVAEDIVAQLADTYTIFRFYNVIGSDGFGQTNPDGLYYNLTKSSERGVINVYGTDYNTPDGSCIREYIHVNDICKSIIKAIYKPSNAIENLAYGEPKSVLEIINIFKTVNNVEFAVNILPRRDGDPAEIYLTNQSNYVTKSYTYEEMLKL